MLRLFIVLAMCAGLKAQILLPILNGRPTVTTYTGPGDLSSGAVTWWGLRAYSVAKKGNAAINVCNVADAACADMLTDATTGVLVITTIGGSDCSMVTCTVKTIYDQTQGTTCSGAACDLTQATISLRPVLTINCIGSRPCLSWTSSSQVLISAGIWTQPTAMSASAICKRTGSTTSYSGCTSSGTGGGLQLTFSNSTNTFLLYAGALNVTATASDNAFHAVQGLIAPGGTSNLYIDGSSTTGDAGSDSAFNDNFCMGNCNNGLIGQSMEAGWWASDTSANFAALNSNQHTYWGF